MLKSTPIAEVLEGPSELTVAIRPGKVLPRKQSCAKPVDGGTLVLSAAKELKSRLQGKMTIRIKYVTKDGDRQNSREIDYTLIP